MSIKEKTIEGKIAAVAAKHRGAGITIPTGDAYIRAIKMAMVRAEGADGGNVAGKRQRLPLTYEMLQRGKLSVPRTHKAQVCWLGLALSYFLLARASELWAYDDGGIHSDFCLLRSDLRWLDEMGAELCWMLRHLAVAVEITFRGQQGRPAAPGAMIVKTDSTVDLIRTLINLSPGLPVTAPLLTQRSGVTVTRKEATSVLRSMVKGLGADFKPASYALHSGRIGGATALAAAGLTDAAIMAAGRWKSDAFMVYVRPNQGDRRAVAAALVAPKKRLQRA